MFNFPRVSGRILTVGVVGLSLAAALGLAALRRRAGRRAGLVSAAVLALLVADYLPARAPGLTTLPLAHPVYDRLARDAAHLRRERLQAAVPAGLRRAAPAAVRSPEAPRHPVHRLP
jgi:hypothetical protein